MLQNKLVTNNTTLILQPNGDVLIKPRLLRSVMGLALALLLVAGSVALLISAFSDGIVFNTLLWAVALGALAFFLARNSWSDLRKPCLTIEKTAHRVNRSGGQDPQSWPFSVFTGVASVVSASIGRQGRRGDERSQIFQVGLALPDGKLMPLVETGFNQRDKAIQFIAAATGLEIVQARQQ